MLFLPALVLHSEETAGGEVHLLTIEGVINPLTAQYLTRGLREGVEAGVVVVRLNTPGGLESSMREMTQAMLNSPVPVVVYVAPSGARAASAGMFITIAAHVAAMAPGTNIGAAHPVGLGQQTDPVMMEKLVSDAAIRVAEGQRQAAILEAEGARQASILKAEGFALALDKIFAVARTGDSKTMSLQYLDTLKAIGAAPSTKLVVPVEFTSLLRPFLDHAAETTEK